MSYWPLSRLRGVLTAPYWRLRCRRASRRFERAYDRAEAFVGAHDLEAMDIAIRPMLRMPLHHPERVAVPLSRGEERALLVLDWLLAAGPG